MQRQAAKKAKAAAKKAAAAQEEKKEDVRKGKKPEKAAAMEEAAEGQGPGGEQQAEVILHCPLQPRMMSQLYASDAKLGSLLAATNDMQTESSPTV